MRLLGGTGEQDVPGLEFTDWLDSTVQEFELSLSVDGHAFDYVIHIEQKADFEKPRIIHEKALCDGQPLFERDLDGVRFQRRTGIRPASRWTGGRRRWQRSSRAGASQSSRSCRRRSRSC